MTMSIDSTTKKPTRPGTLHLPCCKKDAAPAKTVPIPKPLNPDRGVIETTVDVSADLAPAHRKGPPRREIESAISVIDERRATTASDQEPRKESEIC